MDKDKDKNVREWNKEHKRLQESPQNKKPTYLRWYKGTNEREQIEMEVTCEAYEWWKTTLTGYKNINQEE